MTHSLTMLTKITKQNQHQVITRAPARLMRGEQAKAVFQGHFFTLWQWKQKLFDGSETIFESLSRADTVTILALTREDQIIMTKQIQPGSQEFWSLPGGIIDQGEEVYEAAKRELLEETGYSSQDWYFLYSGQLNTRVDWANFHLVAKNCELVSEKNLDAGEKIEVELLTWREFAELIKKDEFRNSDFALWWWRSGEKKIS